MLVIFTSAHTAGWTWATADGGQTWQAVSELLPRRVVSLAVAYNDPQRVCVDTESMAMFKSTDGGITLHRGGDVRDGGWWCELAADWRGVVQEGAEAQKTGQPYWGNIELTRR